MKKTTLLTVMFCSILSMMLVQSCKKEKNEEFIADNSTFANFGTWPEDATLYGANPSLGGIAHGGNDSTVIRAVHYKNGQDPSNGKYPVGTTIVKHATSPAGMNEITAMVKRGNNFNPTRGDWEFFMLMPSGDIATDTSGMPMRGANLMGGMCGNCHAAASAKDFIFSK